MISTKKDVQQIINLFSFFLPSEALRIRPRGFSFFMRAQTKCFSSVKNRRLYASILLFSNGKPCRLIRNKDILCRNRIKQR